MFVKSVFLSIFSLSTILSFAQSLQWVSRINIDTELEEMSGLIVHDSIGYTINDSGNKACLYGFSLKTGQILSRHYLDGVNNRDFEALAESDDYFLIGDIGNNFATRKQFEIYAIRKLDVPHNSHPEIISLLFTLPDYIAGWRKKHDFDLESMVVNKNQDSLIIFSKNRLSNQVQVFALALRFTDSIQTAKLLGRFQLHGMVTAAHVFGDDLFLLNYRNVITTLYKIPNYASTPISRWLPISIKVRSRGKQCEALYFSDNRVLIGSERTRINAQCLETFRFK